MASQRQPAQNAAGLSHGLAAGGPGALIGPQGAGACPAAHGELRGQAHIAENGNEQKVDQKEGPAAVAAHLVGETPDIGHTHRGTHRRQDEAPAAGETLGFRVLIHVVPSLRRVCPGIFCPGMLFHKQGARLRAPAPRRFPQRGFFILKLCREKVKGRGGKIRKGGPFRKNTGAARTGGSGGGFPGFRDGVLFWSGILPAKSREIPFTPPPPAPGP